MRFNKIHFCFLFFLLGCITLSGCDRIYGFLQKEGAEELELIGEIKPFERNENVARVQLRLKLFGYAIGNVDGVLGSNTRNAIEKFQEDNGLTTSRFIDYATWKQLMIFDELGLIINEETNPFMIQVALKNAGYEVGSIDGNLGPKSVAMLKKFQENEGLKPDGKIGFRTLSALSRYLPISEEAQ
ncbi:MAG: peptidoglycan-binding protein [Candidatus Omnitrophota bacterium]